MKTQNNLLSQISKERLLELLSEEREKKEAAELILNKIQSKGKRATEYQLDNLQGKLADVMSDQLMYQDEIVEYDADGEQLPNGEKRYIATPALLGVIEKFLAKNNIITNISTNENLTGLQNTLSKKKKHSQTLPTAQKVVNLMD